MPLLEEALDELPPEHVELRARLLVRLAGALRDEISPARRDKLSREAIELARRSGNPSALAHALDGRVFAILAPDTLDECIALSSELCELADLIGDREWAVHGRMERLSPNIVIGDVEAVEADLDVARRIAEELRQPVLLWDVCGADAMLALAAGRLAEGEELVDRSLALGGRALPAGVTAVYWVQRYTLSDFRGTARELEPAICDLVAGHPTRPVFRCILAHLHARLGRVAEARRELEDLAQADFEGVPFDQEWLLAMSLVAETACSRRRHGCGRRALSPARPVASPQRRRPSGRDQGAASRYLGILAAALGRWDDAERHFEHALQMNERMGARPWLAHTQLDYADMLRRRGRADDVARSQELARSARTLADEIGLAIG